jgi:glutamate/tyrosine decarboxylase-like PLP-dependent enzyme
MTDNLLAEAAARAIAYRRELDDRPVFPDQAAVEGLTALIEPVPQDGTEDLAVLELLDSVGSPATVASSGGRYFGFVTGGAHTVGLAAAWLATSWDQNAALGVMSPTAGVLDTIAGAWLVNLLSLPAGTQHTFSAGTSAANATCMAVGRDRLLADLGHDAVEDGLFGAPELRVVVSEASHSSVTKALGFVGLGRSAVVTVPADDQGRLRADLLPEAGPPTLVVLQAGNVNSGSFDPFAEVADHFAGTPHWIHVDGAFGLWAAASPQLAELVHGMDRAHSWAVDMHKWLNVTYDSAVAFVRDPADMARTFRVGAAYLPDGERLDPVHRGPDMSQRARAVETWAVLKSLGATGVAELLDRTCGFARRFATELPAAGFQVHNDVVLNQVMVSLDDDDATDEVLSALSAEGTMWAGGSMWNGTKVIRLSVSGWATTEEDIDRSIAALRTLAAG